MTAHPKPVSLRLSDEAAERVRQSVAVAIDALQQMPAAGLTVIANVVLKDGVITPIRHPLGRIPQWVATSAVRNAATAGVVVEYRDGKVPRDQYVQLRAVSFGGDITVDVLVL